MALVRDMNEKLNQIERQFPSISSRVATLKKYLLLLWPMIFWMPIGSTKGILKRISLVRSSILDIELSLSTRKEIDNLIIDCMLNLEDIKPATKELFAGQMKYDIELYYGNPTIRQELEFFVEDLVDAQQQVLDSSEEAVTCIQNLRAYMGLSKHLEKVCRHKWFKIWHRARAVADHTAMLFYSCLFEPDTDLNLKLTDLLQMTDPTHQAASPFYLEIFNSLGDSSDKIPFPDTDEMNFINHLLLYLKNQIILCHENRAGFQIHLETLKTLVKASVSYSPLSLQNMSTKIILNGSIIKHATTVFLSVSFRKAWQEKKLDESFEQFVDELVKSDFIGHLRHYNNEFVKDHLEWFSEYMTFFKSNVSYAPLRYMFSKIILQKVIVQLVIVVSSLSSIDTKKVEDNKVKKNDLVIPAEFERFMEDLEKIHCLQLSMKDEVIEEREIGQYIDGLDEIQKQYLSSSTQAIISIQNLRSFQHLVKGIADWYGNDDLLNNHKSQLLVFVEHTTIFFCSCWIEPEKNQELKLTQLLEATTIKNTEVHNIYVHRFKTLPKSLYSPWPNDHDEESFIDDMLFYLKELIRCQTRSLVASLKEQLENLHRYLTVLRNTVPLKDIVPSSRHHNIIPSRMRPFHSLVIKFVTTMATISVTDSEDAEEENLALLHDLEGNVTLLKKELRKSFIFDCPHIGFEFFPIFNNLEEMLTFRTDVIAPMKHQFDMIYTGLLKLRSFLDKIKDKSVENKEQVKDLQRRIAQASCNAEFHIQSYVNKDGPTYYHAMQFSVIIEDIQLLITEIEEHDTDDSCYGTSEETYEQGFSEGSTPNINEIVVGFEDESKAILKHLIGRSESRNIVAIVGMPGLGKTTIAKKVYNHPSTERQFQFRAWCCVSQSYQKKELLLQILRYITEVNDDQILKKSDDEIAAMLYKCLKRCRYLIILDDVWETKVWEDLKKSFPDDSNGSRVIITSRDHSVSQTLIQATPFGYVHPLQVLRNEESYMLLEKKLFPQDGFPTELADVGMMIAKNCKGLPLSVVLAAGILSKVEKKKGHWISIGESLSTQIVNEEGNECKTLLELSYTHLPDHLKCCFLYFGVFPEDKEIPARKLAWLWIAEGFVRDANSERLEDIAEHYLMDLIGRSLVIGSKSASRPGVKSCHVHDLLRDFCLAKAEEENFLKVVHGYNEDLPPDIGSLDYGVDPGHDHDPSKITYLQHRLSIHCKRKHFILAKPSGPNLRTLFFHALADMYPNCPYEASFISRYFKLINVLDLGNINIGALLTGVALMLHLRYLAVNGDIESIPESIENLRKLETFILRGSRIALISVPNSIWRLLRLRHLHIDDRISIEWDNRFTIGKSTILTEMESFSTPTISYGDNVEELLRRLPNLRKLKCLFSDSWNHFEKCNQFPVLEFLTQLISLNVSWNYMSFRSSQWPCRFSFPSNLTKLTLSEFGLPWTEISSIGRLPNLISLKLLLRAFSGKRWNMRKGEFLALKYLKLELLDIKEWTATNEHIPKLQRLMLSKCENLKEIPSEIGDIATLEIIEVRWCNTSATNSARSIQEIAEEEYGNATLKVHIYPNEENPGAFS